ncbi:endonuclease III [Vagococcus silagei]|uniref:Endonuclease III n=1 Tax=Vagococcus silagei TaxID=2508885 RepID=A0A4S3B0W9_9ENTE|nr:endonuclease III [Vagococcus silagei]THB60661.1 endonuclease III [Vagococcus silagei]
MLSKKKTLEALELMKEMYPDAEGELRAETPFQYLVAVMLSAQATDASVNKATPNLFEAYSTPHALAQADEADIRDLIRTIGLYKTKAKNIKKTAQEIDTTYQGQVPTTIKELMKLPGVGQKTANVVAGDLFNVPAIAVDTHVERISKRLRICKKSATLQEVETELMKKIPKEEWVLAHHTMILFGRYHCVARSPKCTTCPLIELCLEGQQRLKKQAN